MCAMSVERAEWYRKTLNNMAIEDLQNKISIYKSLIDEYGNDDKLETKLYICESDLEELKKETEKE